MVIVLQPSTFDSNLYVNPKCKPSPVLIPVIDLTESDAKTQIVKACEEFGFFKVINHGVRPDLLSQLEQEAIKFFALPHSLKDKASPPDPFGYGTKRIGPNGDVGWLEYILLNANLCLWLSQNHSRFPAHPCNIQRGSGRVHERDEENVEQSSGNGRGRVKDRAKAEAEPFGESEGMLISLLRSNDSEGLQICVKDGTWVDVTPDHSSFFVLVGDTLQVMTNGRFMSVKHRVVTSTKRSRISMIYFAGPPLSEKIAPLSCLVPKQDDCLYNEFTWSQYKLSAYKTKLGDYRLGLFEKRPPFSLSNV
ncbi:Oxoglutarate/iron-dependent dioxygenase [Arabidopsis thaliana x Arabidopsis arenosa]|uniref:Oxoglutarate/iron-dependent dioxygenase n=1 Tax=Arabidopsis thaliana x Arabidopsis arenosa TaxID=1240361 RepID=A0A8T2A897_9BRAS|nr:Oxoglutarate/iron-dependent dioxygenase [Arabidopsis thaliana x Arabidopsis arenosa]